LLAQGRGHNQGAVGKRCAGPHATICARHVCVCVCVCVVQQERGSGSMHM
jgi:hypothetical protein